MNKNTHNFNGIILWIFCAIGVWTIFFNHNVQQNHSHLVSDLTKETTWEKSDIMLLAQGNSLDLVSNITEKWIEKITWTLLYDTDTITLENTRYQSWIFQIKDTDFSQDFELIFPKNYELKIWKSIVWWDVVSKEQGKIIINLTNIIVYKKDEIKKLSTSGTGEN